MLLVLMAINIILLMALLTLIFLKLNQVLGVLNQKIKLCRGFIDYNEGFFSILFIILFTLEQAILIILIFIFDQDLNTIKLIVSIFSLVVITTAAIQKFILETKRKYEKERELAKKAKKLVREMIEKLK